MDSIWAFLCSVSEGYGSFCRGKGDSVEWVGWEIPETVRQAESDLRSTARSIGSRPVCRIIMGGDDRPHLVAVGAYYPDAWDRAGRFGLDLMLVAECKDRLLVPAITAALIELFQNGSLAFRLMRAAEIEESTLQLSDGFVKEEIIDPIWEGFAQSSRCWDPAFLEVPLRPFGNLELDIPGVWAQCLLTAAVIGAQNDLVTEVRERVEGKSHSIEVIPPTIGKTVKASSLVRSRVVFRSNRLKSQAGRKIGKANVVVKIINSCIRWPIRLCRALLARMRPDPTGKVSGK